MSFTNAQLAVQIANLISYWAAFNEEYSNWIGGTVAGGPNTDGEYPLTNWAGEETLLPCPALLSDNVTGYVATVAASAAAAFASETAAGLSETEATAQAVIATAQAVLADADRISAETAESGAVDAKVTAIAQAAAAVVSAAAALVSENAALVSENAAEAWANTAEDTLVANPPGDGATEYSALHWAAKAAASAAAAATFDPDLFAELSTQNTFAGIMRLSRAVPKLELYETDAAADEALYDFRSAAGSLALRTRTDADGAGATIFNITRTGTVVDGFDVQVPMVADAIAASGAVTGSNLNVTNWDTAYGWGDWAATVALKAPLASPSFTGTSLFTAPADGTVNIQIRRFSATGRAQFVLEDEAGGDLWRCGTTGAGSTDFTFYDGSANRLVLTGTGADVIGTLAATGVVTGSNLNVSNWDTAYGWGDHASGGYAPTASPTFTGTVNAPTIDVDNLYATSHIFMRPNSDIAQGFGMRNSAGTVQGYLYNDSNESFGLLASDGNWAIKIAPVGASMVVNPATTFAAGATITGTAIIGTVDASVQMQSPYWKTDAGSGYGLWFWGSSAYSHTMSAYSDSGFGRLDSSSDYNQYFKMGSGTNRGYVFQTDAVNLFSVNPDGLRTADGVGLMIGAGDNADEDVLLSFNIDRAWNFVADGIDSANKLALRSLNDKNFLIQNSSAVDQFTFNTNSGDFTALANVEAATFNDYALSSAASGPPGNSQILKTHTNGYTYVGWLNTVSGATAVDPIRIYASNDSFIRYMTPATFIDFLQGEAWDFTAAVTCSSDFAAPYGIQGDYSGTSGASDWGANIWSMDTSWDGAIAGPDSAKAGSHYGIRWLRTSHVDARAVVDEGLYIYRAGTEIASFGNDGAYLAYDLQLQGHLDLNGNIVGDGASTITGIETISIDSTGDITKTSHGNYLYHHSTSYDNDQNGGITFSTSAPSGGTTGDIWFEYT